MTGTVFRLLSLLTAPDASRPSRAGRLRSWARTCAGECLGSGEAKGAFRAGLSRPRASVIRWTILSVSRLRFLPRGSLGPDRRAPLLFLVPGYGRWDDRKTDSNSLEIPYSPLFITWRQKAGLGGISQTAREVRSMVRLCPFPQVEREIRSLQTGDGARQAGLLAARGGHGGGNAPQARRAPWTRPARG